MPATTRYDRVAITLHWVIALLIIGMLALGFLFNEIPKPLRFTMYDIHKATGITILALSLFRLVWRFLNPPPALPASMPAWQQKLAHLAHWLLYGFMVAMPLSGWLMTSAGGKFPINYYGLGTVPFLPMPADEALRKALHDFTDDAHYYMAYGALLLLAGHIGAVLYHQYVQRDQLIRRMLPGKGSDA